MSHPIAFHQSDIEQSIPSRFEKIVELYPEHIAVKTPEQSFTYQDFNHSANQVARAILERRGIKPEPVLLVFDRGSDLLVSIFAVLKAGKIYTVLDPNFPVTKLKQIVEDSQSELILTNSDYSALSNQLASDRTDTNEISIININQVNHYSAENLNLSLTANDLSVIFYTSGSTGKPKGVVRDHRLIMHRVWLDVELHAMCWDYRYSLMHSCAFAGSVGSLFTPLLNGLTVYTYHLKQLGTASLAEFLLENKITHSHIPINAFYQFLETLNLDTYFTSLKLLTLSGDKLYQKAVDRFWQYCSPECLIQHRYASSEGSFMSRFLLTSIGSYTSKIVPAGKPVSNKQILILDEQGNQLEANEVGEIAIKSRYLAVGYWRNPELTQSRFLNCDDGERIYLTGDLGQLSSEGILQHLGRKDFMVKIRGYRVEIPEVEAALSHLPEVKQAAVVAQSINTVEKRLVAYVIPNEDIFTGTISLQHQLRGVLPDYCIPSALVLLQSLPLTNSGKIDRLALPLPSPTRPDLDYLYVAARTPTEQILVEIWQEVLGLEPIGVNDPFLDLGGDSLQAMQIINRVISRFNVRLPLHLLFESATIAQMAEVVDTYLNTSKASLEELSSIPYLTIREQVLTIKELVPIGRSLNEYIQIFNLSTSDLEKRILGVADGPASFNAEMAKAGKTVISVDPLYQFDKEAIYNRCYEAIQELHERINASPAAYVWNYHQSVDEMLESRGKVIERFISDYDLGKAEQRYIVGELPHLSFKDNEFDLSLCSHFLFLYSGTLDYTFHLRSILEMLRVSKEVRIFPLVKRGVNGSIFEVSPYLANILEYLNANNYLTQIIQVDYELYKGGNQMLQIIKMTA